MDKIKPRTLSGFMELLPARQVQFDRMVEILRKSYSLYGFTPLDTPVIESSEVLLAMGRDDQAAREGVRISLGWTTTQADVDRLIPELQEWQQRPLSPLYAMVWFDAIHFKCRDNGAVQGKALYNVYAVNHEGIRELLGIYIAESESARFWLEVLQDLRLRGVQDILIACTDNLKGFSEAISSTFPETVVQSCIVHQVRNTLKYVVCKDYKAITADMRAIYSSPTLEAAEGELTRFTERWEKKYPTAVRSWQENWYKLSSFFDFGKEIRRLMYTTNPIEGIHRRMRKVTKTKGCFPSDMAIKKLVYLVIRDINASTKAEVAGWKLIYGQLCIKFAERMAKFGA